jgi:hypothetical protein
LDKPWDSLSKTFGVVPFTDAIQVANVEIATTALTMPLSTPEDTNAETYLKSSLDITSSMTGISSAASLIKVLPNPSSEQRTSGMPDGVLNTEVPDTRIEVIEIPDIEPPLDGPKLLEDPVLPAAELPSTSLPLTNLSNNISPEPGFLKDRPSKAKRGEWHKRAYNAAKAVGGIVVACTCAAVCCDGAIAKKLLQKVMKPVVEVIKPDLPTEDMSAPIPTPGLV